MNRRDFLKLSPLVFSTLLVAYSPVGRASNSSVQLRVGKRVFLGTSEGEIFISRDLGTTWKLHTNFGPGVAIRDLFTDRAGRVAARAEYADYPFRLVLSDEGNYWITV